MIRARTRGQLQREAAEKRSKQSEDRPLVRDSLSSPTLLSSSATPPVTSSEKSAESESISHSTASLSAPSPLVLVVGSAAAPTESELVPPIDDTWGNWTRIRNQRLPSDDLSRRHKSPN